MQTRNLFACVLLALSMVLSIGPVSAVENKRDQGIKCYNAKNFKQAVTLLDQHLTAYPQDIYALYYDALACQGIGDMGKAKIYYRQVATLAPGHQLGGYAITALRQIDPSFRGGSASSSPSSSSSTSSRSTSRASSGGQSNQLDSSIPMEWDVQCEPADQGVWVDVKLNGRPIKMIVDTGAPTMALGRSQLEAAGIEYPKPPAKSADGSAERMAARGYFPMNVKIGPVEKNVMVHILDNNHGTPLVGQTYIGLFEYTLDPGAKRIHFKQRGYNKGANRNAIEVPFEFVKAGNRIVVRVEINGRANPCIFDTGNTAAGIIFFNSAQAEKYGVRVPQDAEMSLITGVHGTVPARKFTLPRVRLGPIDKNDVVVQVQEGRADDLPLLGQPFWQGFEYTINREKSVIEFVRR